MDNSVLNSEDLFKFEPIINSDRTDGEELTPYRRRTKIQTKLRRFKNFLEIINPWSYLLKSIENNCDCGVLSYFRFVSFLVNLNLVMVLLQLAILVLPFEFLTPSNLHDFRLDAKTSVSRHNKFSQALSCSNRTGLRTVSNSVFLDIIQGTGPLEQLPIFQGFFFNKTYFNVTENAFGSGVFNTPVAYLFAFWLCLLSSLFLSLLKSGKVYKNYVMDENEFKQSFGYSIFTGINFRITDERRVKMQITENSKSLKFQHEQIQKESRHKMLSTTQRFEIYLIRAVVNVFFLLFLIVVFILINLAQKAPVELMKYEVVANNKILLLLKDYTLSATVALVNIVFVFINNKVIGMEQYQSSVAIGVSLKRIVLVQAISLLIFIETLINRISDTASTDPICRSTNYTTCWETYVGQEFYRLTVIGLATSLLLGPLLLGIRVLVFKKGGENKFVQLAGAPHFDISTQGFQHISSQTICWMGLWFCPFLPVLLFVKTILLFFIHKVLFMQNLVVTNINSSFVSGAQHFFLDWLLYSLAFVMVPIGFLLSKTPSRGCGPFRIFDTDRSEYSVASGIGDYLASLSEGLRTVWNGVSSVYVLIVLVLVMLIATYIVYAQSTAYWKYVSGLKKQIILEEKDSQFIRQQIVRAKEIVEKMQQTQ